MPIYSINLRAKIDNDFKSVGKAIATDTITFNISGLVRGSTYQYLVKENIDDTDEDAVAGNYGTLASDYLSVVLSLPSASYTVGTTYYFALRQFDNDGSSEVIQVSFTIAQNAVLGSGSNILRLLPIYLPNFTTEERNELVSDNAMLIYNTDTEQVEQYDLASESWGALGGVSESQLTSGLATKVGVSGIQTINGTLNVFRFIANTAGALIDAVRIGNSTNNLTIHANNGGAELGTENGTRIRSNSPLRFDAVAGNFTINRMPLVIRCETDQEDANAKGTFIEWDQLFRAGETYSYGIGSSAYRNWLRNGSLGSVPTFTVNTTGQKRVMWFGQHYESASGTGETTHMHCNWESCKADMSTIITRLQVGYGEDWTEVSVVNADFAVSKNAKLFLASDADVYLTMDGTTDKVRLNAPIFEVSSQIKNITPPTDPKDAVTKEYLDSNENDWQQTDYGFKSWAYDIVNITNTYAVPSGRLVVARLRCRRPTTINSASFVITNTPAGLANCYMAVYQNDVLLAQSTDQSASWSTAGLKTATFASPVSLEAGTVDVVLWAGTQSTQIQIGRGSGFAGSIQGLPAGQERFGLADSGITTTAPSTLGARTPTLTVTHWVAVS